MEKTIDGYVRFEDFATHTYIYAQAYERPLKKNSLAQAFRRLRKDGYIDLEEYNNKLIVKLTETGKTEATLRRVLLDEKWDGIWRVVIFDIPEKHKKARDALRSKLKTWGFIPWQKSVWASKKNITFILRDFIAEIGIAKWVVILESVDSPQ